MENIEKNKQEEKLQQEIIEKLKGYTVKEAKRNLYRIINNIDATVKIV